MNASMLKCADSALSFEDVETQAVMEEGAKASQTALLV